MNCDKRKEEKKDLLKIKDLSSDESLVYGSKISEPSEKSPTNNQPAVGSLRNVKNKSTFFESRLASARDLFEDIERVSQQQQKQQQFQLPPTQLTTNAEIDDKSLWQDKPLIDLINSKLNSDNSK